MVQIKLKFFVPRPQESRFVSAKHVNLKYTILTNLVLNRCLIWPKLRHQTIQTNRQ